MPQQQGNQLASAGDGADLDIFGLGSLGSGLVSVVNVVSDFAWSAADLLPISEEHEHGECPASHPRNKAGRSSLNTLSTDSPQPSARSKASTKPESHGMGGVARFGEAAESYYVSEADRVTGARCTRVYSSSSREDGLRVPKQKDPCDKATHSKISSWMTRTSAPAPRHPAASVPESRCEEKLPISAAVARAQHSAALAQRDVQHHWAHP
jgi:hypothetical protein